MGDIEQFQARANEVDADPPDPRATKISIEAVVSSTSAIHARAALADTIERMDPDGSELWSSWPLRRLVNVLDEAIEHSNDSDNQ